jgi:hypothetical protein
MQKSTSCCDGTGFMPHLISRTNISFDPEKLTQAFEMVAGLPQQWHALAVTSKPVMDNPPPDGMAPNPDEEMLYNVINAEFRGTYFEEILTGLPFSFGRTRIMFVPPQKCYPIHTDRSIRYHLALDTNVGSLIVYPDAERVYHIPADGYLYKMDARFPHTAINCGPLTRAHMVIITDQQ